MIAAVFDHPGQPEDVLDVRDVPVPTPGRGEVLVRMLASPINPSDLLFISGRYSLQPKYPATPGFEGVGVVESSGPGPLGRFLRGKRVVVMNARTGNWAEKAVASARQVIPVPSDIPDEQAATFFVNPATAIALIRHVLAIPPDSWLLQSAAGSSLGKMIIRLAPLYGIRTINIVRRPEQVDELKRLGADHVLCDPASELAARVRSILPEGVRYAIDPVGGSTGTAVVESLASGGRAVLFGLLSGEPIRLDPRFLITGQKRVEGFWLGDWIQGRTLVQKLRLIRQIRRLIRTGVLTSTVGETFPLSQVREAVRSAAAEGKPGKVLLRLGT